MTSPLRQPVPALLDSRFPLPLDQPFTTAMARSAGIGRHALQRLLHQGLIRRMVKGVYAAAQAEESLILRAEALSLIVPENAVITDWTACWLFTGILPFGWHLDMPPVQLFRHAGHTRLRNELCASGERTFSSFDLMELHGLVVTTPLRTALDLGRLANRDNAIAALDALLRHGQFSRGQLLGSLDRFKGFRGVIQLRALAPLVDARSESPGESVLRLRWLDCSDLPPPEPQISVRINAAEVARLDLGVEELRFAVEYDGEQFHSLAEDREHDERRRSWLSTERGWLIKVVGRKNLFGVTRNIEAILDAGVREARQRLGMPWL